MTDSDDTLLSLLIVAFVFVGMCFIYRGGNGLYPNLGTIAVGVYLLLSAEQTMKNVRKKK